MVLGVGSSSFLIYYKNIFNEWTLTVIHKNFGVLQNSFILAHIPYDIVCRKVCGESCQEAKTILDDITSHNHTQLQ